MKPEISSHERVEFLIDGKVASAPVGTNLIDAIRMNGVEIPTLCWSVGLEPALGTCRVCTVRKNGREVAGCTVQIGKGDVIECGASDLRNLRQGVTELLFSEGNHYCPGCEKSGDCELQSVAYDQGITHSRFPYKFSHYDLDYSGKDLMIERNRCIHCKRCTDLFVDDEGRKVFRFMGKGRKTVVEMDLKLEAEMSKHKKKEAVAICPTGAILFKGQGFDRPIGTRKSDSRSSK
ncbi:MAG: (2Fe-2S)-binding protein [Deltaproteobacteria bacterium]|nr:(2Fe-2S)-binding protein [Deltaproteobacteria bacterium]